MTGKEVFIPGASPRPDTNDFNNPTANSLSNAANRRQLRSFWAKEYGDDLCQIRSQIAVSMSMKSLRNAIVPRLLRQHTKWSTRTNRLPPSIISPLRHWCSGGVAFGGSIDNKIGASGRRPPAQSRPYGVVAHELGHSSRPFSAPTAHPQHHSRRSIHEMTAQWMLWQVYPEMDDLRKLPSQRFMKPPTRLPS